MNSELSLYACFWKEAAFGCTYESACNYNNDIPAVFDDGSCTYPEGETCDCDGNIIGEFCDCDGNIEDCNGVCNGDGVVDVCGVCDGPGLIECPCTTDIGESITSCPDQCENLDQDNDGICDFWDDCICENYQDNFGFDECGICCGVGIPEDKCDCDGN